MSRNASLLRIPSILLAIPVLGGLGRLESDSNRSPNTALINGMWFDGKAFEARTVYSVDGRFTANEPDHVDRTLDLAGTYVVPPFGEAHNHNIGTGVEDRDRRAVRKYLADGVFCVKIQGNLPLTEEMRRRLGLNRPDSIDVVLAQGSLTATGGHPSALVGEVLLRQGYFPG